MKKSLKALRIIFCLLLIVSCDDPQETVPDGPNELNEFTRGAGFISYSKAGFIDDKSINVYYYIPTNVTTNSQILFVFHGNSRNAIEYRNAMISKAEDYNFIVIAPKFSSQDFPGGDKYFLGNVFIDGDNPSPETLNPEQNWAFSIIEPLFEDFKQQVNNTSENYNIFGFSAGGQFAHRYLFFKPNAKINKVVAGGSGWYTAVNVNVNFPYGFKQSPLEFLNHETLLSKKLIVLIGSDDNDPNASSLRNNEFANAQGLTRLQRANYFYSTANNFSISNNFIFNWEKVEVPNLGHEFSQASLVAADLIFN